MSKKPNFLQRQNTAKSLFSRYKSMSFSMPSLDLDNINQANFNQFLRVLLQIDPDERTDAEIDAIKKCTINLEFFKNIVHEDPNDELGSLEKGCRMLGYRKSPKGSLLTLYKDIAREFFITLKGKIGVFVPRSREKCKREREAVKWVYKKIGKKHFESVTDGMLRALEKRSVNNNIYREEVARFKMIKGEGEGVKRRLVYREEYFKSVSGGLVEEEVNDQCKIFSEEDSIGVLEFEKVNTIETGNMFGELGIIYERQRAATCISLEPVELGVMEKEEFNECFSDFQKQEERNKRKFIEDYIIVDSESKFLAGKMGIMFKKKTLQRGNYLFRQNRPLRQVWMLVKGEVAFKYKWDMLVDKSRVAKMKRMPLRVNKKMETFMLLGRGEMVGEECLPKDKSIVPYEVITETECDFYVIDIDKFRHLCEDYPAINAIIKEKIREKEEMIRMHLEQFRDYEKREEDLEREEEMKPKIIQKRNEFRVFPPEPYEFNIKMVNKTLPRVDRLMMEDHSSGPKQTTLPLSIEQRSVLNEKKKKFKVLTKADAFKKVMLNQQAVAQHNKKKKKLSRDPLENIKDYRSIKKQAVKLREREGISAQAIAEGDMSDLIEQIYVSEAVLTRKTKPLNSMIGSFTNMRHFKTHDASFGEMMAYRHKMKTHKLPSTKRGKGRNMTLERANKTSEAVPGGLTTLDLGAQNKLKMARSEMSRVDSGGTFDPLPSRRQTVKNVRGRWKDASEKLNKKDFARRLQRQREGARSHGRLLAQKTINASRKFTKKKVKYYLELKERVSGIQMRRTAEGRSMGLGRRSGSYKKRPRIMGREDRESLRFAKVIQNHAPQLVKPRMNTGLTPYKSDQFTLLSSP